MSLFAIVPLFTVLFTIASAIPAFQGLEEQLQSLMFEHLVPDTSSDIQEYLSDFSQQAKTLTGPGIAFLFVTAVLMLRNVEKALNLIWRARRHRSAISSFLLYWAVLTLGPISIGLALGTGTYLSSFATNLESVDTFGAGAFLIKATPLLLGTAGFSLVYVAVPNCRVPFLHALLGGFITAVAFNFARSIFTKVVVGSSITFIYGAFAAFPLFLLWIYISWIIVLMGGILVHSLSAYQNEIQANRPIMLKALDVLHAFWETQRKGQPLKEKDLLGNKLSSVRGLDTDTWGDLRDTLMAHKVIVQSDQGHYVLSRDLHSVHLWQLQDWVNGELPLDRPGIAGELSWQESSHRLLLDQRKSTREILNVSLGELFNA